jgi:4,5-DOPA dioxygenase extradiol
MTPTASIGHGSPMNTLDTNRYTTAWSAFGDQIGRPRAVPVISAHRYTNATAATAMATAPGEPDVAEEVAEVARPAELPNPAVVPTEHTNL